MLASAANFKEAARHVETVLAQPLLGSELAENGYRLVNELFLSSRMAEETLAVYKKVMAHERLG